MRVKTMHSPRDPAHLGLQLLLERIQGFLDETQQSGFVLIDANKRLEPELREHSSELLREGSSGIAVSKFYGIPYE
jgi:predicted O-methyltransferase YrrM